MSSFEIISAKPESDRISGVVFVARTCKRYSFDYIPASGYLSLCPVKGGPLVQFRHLRDVRHFLVESFKNASAMVAQPVQQQQANARGARVPVVANDQVAHIWAQQETASGRSHNGNFSFEGPTLFSYSTPIARFLVGVDGSKVCLISSETFSKTTSGKHIGPAYKATDYGRSYPVFTVPSVSDGYTGRGTRLNHALNLEHLAAAYRGVLGAAKTVKIGSRQTDRTDYVSERGGLVSDLAPKFIRDATESFVAASRYAKLFGLAFDGSTDAINEALAAFEAREAEWNTPERQAKRAADAAKRQAKADRSIAKKLAAWRAGERVAVPATDSEGRAYLRPRGDVLETSQGASVPLAHAIKVFRAVKALRRPLDCDPTYLSKTVVWQRNGVSIRVGHFQVDAIYADGSFKAGCHHIGWSEIERVAAQVGVLDMPGDVAAAVEGSH